jgi:hypothetical protein
MRRGERPPERRDAAYRQNRGVCPEPAPAANPESKAIRKTVGRSFASSQLASPRVRGNQAPPAPKGASRPATSSRVVSRPDGPHRGQRIKKGETRRRTRARGPSRAHQGGRIEPGRVGGGNIFARVGPQPSSSSGLPGAAGAASSGSSLVSMR